VKILSGPAEAWQKSARVALLDNFQNTQNGLAHGEMTESVLLSQGLSDQEIQRFHCGSSNDVDLSQLNKLKGGKLRALIQEFAHQAGQGILKATSANLTHILQEHPNIRVISQSQSQSPLRIGQTFFAEAQKDDLFRRNLAVAFELMPDTPLPEVAESLFAFCEQAVRQDSPARREYLGLSRQVAEKGIVHLVAGGNLGEFAATTGAKLSPSAARSLLANDFTTTVGASDAQGQPLALNSPGAAIEVWAKGESIPIFDPSDPQLPPQQGDGTSFAVPLLAARVDQLLSSNPRWGSFEVEAQLQGQEAIQVSLGQSDQLGDKILVGDGKIEEFLGSTTLSGLHDPELSQFVNAQGKSFRLVFQGEQPDQAQVLDCRENGEGQRRLHLETYSQGYHHVLQAEWENGQLLEQRTREALYRTKP
jgi:hypothetical protein